MKIIEVVVINEELLCFICSGKLIAIKFLLQTLPERIFYNGRSHWLSHIKRIPWILIDKENKTYKKENILVPAFMQIDSLTMSAGKNANHLENVVSNTLLILFPIFLHRFTFSTLHALSRILSASFSLCLPIEPR